MRTLVVPQKKIINTPIINLLIMKNLMLTITDSFQHFNNEMTGLNDYLRLTTGSQGETLEFYNNKGVKKVFDVHHYSTGNAILFKK